MPSARPACEIEPVSWIASNSRTLPGPIARLPPKSTRSVSLVSGMPAPRLTVREDYHRSCAGEAVARGAAELRWKTRCRFARAQSRQAQQQASQARGLERQVSLARLAAEPFDEAHGIVADAVDREQRPIGVAD